MSRFDGQIALVTGGASGIGLEVALGFARDGGTVLICDLSEENGNKAVAAIESSGGRALFERMDVADPTQVEAAVGRAVTELGAIDVLVGNAGIGPISAPTGEIDLDDWNRVIAINLNGVMYGMRYALPEMVKQGRGSIITTSSMLGLIGFANAPAYIATKHAVTGLTKAAALEYGDQGIRVNSVHPGFVDTPLNRAHGIAPGTDAYDMLAAKAALGRIATANEIAPLILWLASDEASFVTGSQFVADGGFSAQ